MWLFQALSPAGDSGWAGKSRGYPLSSRSSRCPGQAWLGSGVALVTWPVTSTVGHCCRARQELLGRDSMGTALWAGNEGLHTRRATLGTILKGDTCWGQKGVWLLCCGLRVVHSSVGGREGPQTLGLA